MGWTPTQDCNSDMTARAIVSFVKSSNGGICRFRRRWTIITELILPSALSESQRGSGCVYFRMLISEVFHSIQGEGRFTGEPSSFVRTSGCNLRCWFCDTPYTSWSAAGDERTVGSLIAEVAAFECRHVVITGGEPMLLPELVPLTAELHRRDHFITIETAGTIYRKIHADLMSISPKCSNSTPTGTEWASRHNQRRHQPDVIRNLIADYPYQFKFVIDAPSDIYEVQRYLTEFPEIDQSSVYLMPQGVEPATLHEKQQWLESEAAQLGWKVSPRKHIELYGNRPGT